MTRHTLHIPLQYNDGSNVSPHILDEIEQRLENIAGGWTSTDAVGGWRGEDRSYREPVRLYLIDTAEHEQRLILELARTVASALGQEAVYVTRQHIETFLIEPAREEIPA